MKYLLILLLTFNLPLMAQTDTHQAFFDKLAGLCGQTFTGQSSFPDDPKDSFYGKPLVAHIAECGPAQIRVPFQVGTDTSRTWVFNLKEDGLQLQHDHRHQDGTPHEVNLYGGMATAQGTALQQSFAADTHTIGQIPEAATNVWTLTLSEDGQSLIYYLERHGKPRFKATLYRQP